MSEKLHRRAGRRTLSLRVGVTLEIAAVGAGGALIAAARRADSSAAAIAGMLLWVTALEPLVKIAAGSVAGIRFSHAYLLGAEPRFKMRYGTYVAAPPLGRIWFHLAGCVGSPLGAWLAARLACGRLPTACTAARVVLWTVSGVNAALLLAGLVDAPRWVRTRLGLSSGGAAGREIRRLAARIP